MKTKIPDGGAAFPQPGVIHFDRERQMFECVNPINGMSLRDYFAGQALVARIWGLVDFKDSLGSDDSRNKTAIGCYLIADAMIRHREAKSE